MLRFWSTDSKGRKPVESHVPLPSWTGPTATTTTVPDTNSVTPPGPPPPPPPPPADRPPKRRRSSLGEGYDESYPPGPEAALPPSKRAKTQDAVAMLSPRSISDCGDVGPLRDDDDAAVARRPDLDEAREIIRYQFGLEILLKHDELRLINQELAKCQIALEQLRRCHLIPYPVSCPTPAQMLDISSGTGPAVQRKPGEPVPAWAPPFGVVDGPYARHYAKWLIPDPRFDGVPPEPQGPAYASRAKSGVLEGRTTRNSLSEPMHPGKGRPSRGVAGQRLHALSSGYPQPKDKHSPCILRRSDGQTVKLICLDCQRWDFSSTQGFINHCRIAHRRDFKSHEEAAVHCGHPVEVDETGGIVGEEKAPAAAAAAATTISSSASGGGLVHPLARSEPVSDLQAYAALRSRISRSLELYRGGKATSHGKPGAGGSGQSPAAAAAAAAAAAPAAAAAAKATGGKTQPGFVGAAATPYLSKLLQKKEFGGNLDEYVSEAKSKVDADEEMLSGEESEDADGGSGASNGAATPVKPPAGGPTARGAGVMRVPARTVVSPVPIPTIPRPTSAKGRTPRSVLGVAPPAASSTDRERERDEGSSPYGGDGDGDDDEMDMDLSPNTMASNNAPSLVSDDGEYDDSDDGRSSVTSESLETESVSDVAEINIDEDHEGQEVDTPRPIRHHRTNSGTTVQLRKEDGKHVTFVTPLTGPGRKAKGRRKQKV